MFSFLTEKKSPYFDRPSTTGMEEMRILFSDRSTVLNVPDVETMIIVETG